MASWIKPKTAHKEMVQRLLRAKIHVILCFRAEQKVEMVKEDGRMKIQEKKSLTGLDGWIPISEKTLPFELTASFLLTASKPGIPQPIKLQQQHRALFPLDKPITEESGRLIAEWSAGASGSAHAPPHDPYKALAAADSVSALKAVFAKEWRNAPETEKQAVKTAYDARLAQLEDDPL